MALTTPSISQTPNHETFTKHQSEIVSSTMLFIVCYLSNILKLQLHPDKVFIKTLSSGVDFLGWVHFPTHRVLRTSTKRKMIRRLLVTHYDQNIIQSYMGMLRYGNSYKLKKKLFDLF